MKYYQSFETFSLGTAFVKFINNLPTTPEEQAALRAHMPVDEFAQGLPQPPDAAPVTSASAGTAMTKAMNEMPLTPEEKALLSDLRIEPSFSDSDVANVWHISEPE